METQTPRPQDSLSHYFSLLLFSTIYWPITLSPHHPLFHLPSFPHSSLPLSSSFFSHEAICTERLVQHREDYVAISYVL